MAQKLLVRTPRTQDGVTPIYNDKKQVVYGESLVEPNSKPYFESLNASRPDVLKHEFSLVDVDAKGRIVPNIKKDADK